MRLESVSLSDVIKMMEDPGNRIFPWKDSPAGPYLPGDWIRIRRVGGLIYMTYQPDGILIGHIGMGRCLVFVS